MLAGIKLGKDFQKLLAANESFNNDFMEIISDLYTRLPYIDDQNYDTPFLFSKRFNHLFEKHKINAEALVHTNVSGNIGLSIKLFPVKNIVYTIQKPKPILARFLFAIGRIIKRLFSPKPKMIQEVQ
jgi:hypothetical protein